MEEVKKIALDGNKNEDSLLPGFRFHPTDEELVGFYLRRKVEKKPICLELIKHADIYKYDPWDLPKVSSVGEREWYFFCMRGRKYRNSIRPNRVTGSGFWKATGIDKPIYSTRQTHECIGLKKSLVYYKGSAGKGTKTDWMMHEFRLPASESSSPSGAKTNNAQEAEVWTLCRIFKRNSSYRQYASNCRETNDSRSKTWSADLENGGKRNSDTVSAAKVKETKRDEDQFFAGQLTARAQLPFDAASYFSLADRTFNGYCSAADGSWDELRPVVEFAIDSSPINGFI